MSQGNRNYFSCPICRNQRRRHDDNCEFGQYFLGRSTDFESACRLFGFANLVRLMRSVEPSERQATADSILMEANIWDRDPINGAYGHVFNLVSQIQSFESELETINNWLAHIRDQQRQPSSFSPNIPNQSIQDDGSIQSHYMYEIRKQGTMGTEIFVPILKDISLWSIFPQCEAVKPSCTTLKLFLPQQTSNLVKSIFSILRVEDFYYMFSK